MKALPGVKQLLAPHIVQANVYMQRTLITTSPVKAKGCYLCISDNALISELPLYVLSPHFLQLYVAPQPLRSSSEGQLQLQGRDG